MAAPLPPVRRRRRPRRGSLERPVSTQLYRGAFLLCSVPLLLAAFSVTKPGPLQKPLLPPAFDARATLALTRELSSLFPDPLPGSAGDRARGGSVSSSALRPADVADTWRQAPPRRAGRSASRTWSRSRKPAARRERDRRDGHRDDTGRPGRERQRDRHRADRARTRCARPLTEAQSACSRPTLVFLSTDGGAYGGLGARFVERSSRDRLSQWSTSTRSPGRDRRLEPQATGRSRRSGARRRRRRGSSTDRRLPHHPGFFGQLVDLGFRSRSTSRPFVARGCRDHAHHRRQPSALGTRRHGRRLATPKLAQMGRAAQELLGSLNQGRGAQRTTTDV